MYKPKKFKVDYLIDDICVSQVEGWLHGLDIKFREQILRNSMVFFACARLNESPDSEVEVPEGAYMSNMCYNVLKKKFCLKKIGPRSDVEV